MKNLDKLMEYTNINNIAYFYLDIDNDIMIATVIFGNYDLEYWEAYELEYSDLTSGFSQIIKKLLFSRNKYKIQLALNLL